MNENTFGTNGNGKKSEPVLLSMNALKTESNGRSSKVLEREPIPNSPFTLVTVEGKGTFIAIGMTRITEHMHKEKARDMVDSRHWEIVTALVVKVTEGVIEAVGKEYATREQDKITLDKWLNGDITSEEYFGIMYNKRKDSTQEGAKMTGE